MPITTPNVALTGRTARTSRPPETDPKFDSQEDVDAHFSPGQPRARVADDRTRWCRRCDQTAPPGPNSAFCTTHYDERKAHMKRVRKARAAPATPAHRAPDHISTGQTPAPAGTVPVPTQTLRVLAERSDLLIAAVGLATANFQRLPKNSRKAWVHELMLAAKEMHLAVKYGLPELPAPDNDET